MSRRSISARVGRLEQKSRALACPHCKGAGRVISVMTHLEPDPVDPEGCPGCGRLTVVRVVRAERVALDFTPVAQVSSC
ncbi:MAG: hypothetical protein KDA31_12160 [Phycisphaerales bacterium]|nr:hypothetical protein [Phycisphaerales bacterium]MCB9836748.1 hypothetical protein [Phycisphaera sp.]